MTRRQTSSATRSAPTRADEMIARLRADGLKVTAQRLAIVRAIADDATHPTAQELFDRLRPVLPKMSFATVYNTLDALSAAGLCAARQLSSGAARFDPNTRPHHHAVCDACGVVFDVAAAGGPQLGAVEVAPGFVVRAVERVYRGLCGDCAGAARRKKSRPPS